MNNNAGTLSKKTHKLIGKKQTSHMSEVFLNVLFFVMFDAFYLFLM